MLKLTTAIFLFAFSLTTYAACADTEKSSTATTTSNDPVARALSSVTDKSSGAVTELHIAKVSCMSCAYKIRKGLKPVAGVTNIKVDPETQTLRYECQNCDHEAVKAKLEEIGYPASNKT
jgi:copper chaperone CopZ